MKIIILFIFLAFSATMMAFETYHVKVSGTPSGDGSINNPWDLQTALTLSSGVLAGDTVWVHGGTYVGHFVSDLWGYPGYPVIVRAVPGEEVILDGNVPGGNAVLSFGGGDFVYIWGFTIMNSDNSRTNNKDGVYFTGANNKLINCIIRDNGGNGIGFWNPAVNSEIYGCIIYHNGVIGPTRGHGHGIYTQNTTGAKQIRDNIIFNSFGIGIQAYTEGGNIQGFNIEGNTFFNCGLPYAQFLERHILVGGLKPADRVTINDNYFYNRPAFPSKAMMQFGYSYSANNLNASFTNNYMVDGSFYNVTSWNSMTVTNNTIISRASEMQLVAFDDYSNITNPVFNNNSYYRGNLATLSFNDWKSATGQDDGSTYSPSTPGSTVYFLQKNEYEAGRANLTIYNWGQESQVAVDVSDILSVGDKYELLDVSNLPGGSVLSGVYAGGSILVPMQLTAVSLPNGVSNNGLYVHTAPHFGAFLIKRSGQGSTHQEPDPQEPEIQEPEPEEPGSQEPEPEEPQDPDLQKPEPQNPETQEPDPLDPGDPSANESVGSQKSTVFPNPVIDYVSVNFHSTLSGAVSIEIFDLSGKAIKSETIDAIKGENQYVCDLSSLRQGFYVLVVRGSHGRISTNVVLKE